MCVKLNTLFVFVTLMICSYGQDGCLSITQRYEAVSKGNTTLDCVIGPDARLTGIIHMVWSSRNLTSGITTTLSYILGIPAHVIATDESTRVRGSYSPEIGRDGAFTLLIHGLTLEDDAIETEWICEMLLPFCREDRSAHSMIITGTLSRMIEPIKVYCDKMVCNCSLPSLLS